MENRETFAEAVLGHWAERFNCTIDDLNRPGTVLVPEETFADSAAVHVWVIGQRAFARMDPALAETAAHVMAERPDTTIMTGDLLREALGPEGVLRTEESLLRYLIPTGLQTRRGRLPGRRPPPDSGRHGCA